MVIDSTNSSLQMLPKHEAWLREFLKRSIPEYEVWAFGSRATWTARDASDLDLVLRNSNTLEKPLSISLLSELKEGLMESDIPFLVDILDWSSISTKFRHIIERSYIVIQSNIKTSNQEMVEWKEYQLWDVCLPKEGIQTGPFGSQLHKEDYVEKGTPIITVEHLGDNRITLQNLPLVSDFDKERLKKYTLQEGDIVFSRVGSVDRRSLIRSAQNGWLFSGRCLRIRVDPQIVDSEFLSYEFGLDSFKEHIRSVAVGATMPSLNTQILSEIRICLPSLNQQKAIARVLSSLDDKIELNRRMNKTLEAMAKALFKSWFVDFDPVRVKAEGIQPVGLTPDILALFPDSFEESELGKIPEGWNVKPLGDITTHLKRGITPKYVEESGVNIINQKCIRNGWIDFSKARRHDSVSRPISNKELKLYDVVINSTGVGTLGRIAQVLELIETSTADSHVTIVRYDKREVTPLVFGLTLANKQDEIEAMGEGSTGQTELSRERLSRFNVLIPPYSLQQYFDFLVKPLFEKIVSNNQRINILSKLRDTILPKLMNGKIRIQEAEAVIKELV